MLDGNPFDPISAHIQSIHPMSEVRNNVNVFVAEASIPNAEQRLKPGMQGRGRRSARFYVLSVGSCFIDPSKKYSPCYVDFDSPELADLRRTDLRSEPAAS